MPIDFVTFKESRVKIRLLDSAILPRGMVWIDWNDRMKMQRSWPRVHAWESSCIERVIVKEKYQLRDHLAILLSAYRAVNFSLTRAIYLYFHFSLSPSIKQHSNHLSMIDRSDIFVIVKRKNNNSSLTSFYACNV